MSVARAIGELEAPSSAHVDQVDVDLVNDHPGVAGELVSFPSSL